MRFNREGMINRAINVNRCSGKVGILATYCLVSLVLPADPMANGQATLLLSELSPSVRRVAVLARVARVWDFNKDSEFKHLDIVFIDKDGNKMYGEILAQYAEKFREKLKEGNVCLVRDFFVTSSKNMYRAVDGNFMIKITPWSTVEVNDDVAADFPRYAYSLTDFQVLPKMVGKIDNFIDVIGIVSGISDILKVRLPAREQESDKRNLQITDIDGNTMEVALWGEHATSFQADDLYNLGQNQPVIVLLVGTLMKSYLGRPTISCSDAAKIYINPDIPEKIEYCTRLGKQMPTMTVMAARDDRYNPAINNERADTVKVEFLVTMNPNEFLGKNMISTITIMRLASEHWWFLSCQMCHRKAFQAGSAFVCSNKKCGCTSATPRYKVRLIGADESGETEFVFFASVAEQAIGKRIEVIMRGASDRPFVVPAEITALISKKFTLHFTVNEKGLHYGQLSFQVNSITQVHANTTVFEFNKLSIGSSSTSTETSMETSKANTSSNDKEPEDKDKDNTDESDKNEGQISPTIDSTEQIAPSSAKEQETQSNIATASKNDSQNPSKKPSKRTGTEANKSTSAKKKMHLT